ncbi:MAG: HAMP domain-containing sensor histidine kinase [Terrisporobacter sp.]|uniref:sensor histidine kinase n=1 Tax=Terrisporobacter sp. TaxID=1965305 RepID=UPI002FCBF52C
MMELIIIILLIISVYFSARFFLLSKNIREIKQDFKEISKDIERNRRLTLGSPNKDLENLLIDINEYLEKTQIEKIKSTKREEEIRKEIENISHDLRTPLTSILGYLQLMKDEDVNEEEKIEYISIVERKSKSLQNLIQTFYDVSRLEANDYKINNEVIDIHKILMENLLLSYNNFQEKNINVEIDLGKEDVNILGDNKAMDRVFSNLIENAIKYSKSDFKVSLKVDNEKAIIIFQNDMEDLKEGDLDNLFNRFYMKDNSRHNQSSGLGLTVTKLLVEAMNGKIKSKIEDNFIEFKIEFGIYSN